MNILEWKARLKQFQCYSTMKRSKSSLEIEKLYLEFLKEEIKLGTNYPNYQDDFEDYHFGNCYTYALGLPSFKSFIEQFTHLVADDIFPFNIGFMVRAQCYENRELEKLLQNFDLDCDALGIQVYETHHLEQNTHGGYKIAFYVSYCRGTINDFHFIRQNRDGIWSHKMGYFSDPQLTFFAPILENHYEHVKTFEIVKPVILERKK